MFSALRPLHFFGAFPVGFEKAHRFELWQVGLTFSDLLVWTLIAVGSKLLWHRNYVILIRNRDLAGREQGKNQPENRLPPAITGAILVPIVLL